MFDFKKMSKEGELMYLQLDDFYTTPDGESRYCSVWGKTRIMSGKDVLGFEPAGSSANWIFCIGDNPDTVLFIMGCRVHYVQV